VHESFQDLPRRSAALWPRSLAAAAGSSQRRPEPCQFDNPVPKNPEGLLWPDGARSAI